MTIAVNVTDSPNGWSWPKRWREVVVVASLLMVNVPAT